MLASCIKALVTVLAAPLLTQLHAEVPVSAVRGCGSVLGLLTPGFDPSQPCVVKMNPQMEYLSLSFSPKDINKSFFKILILIITSFSKNSLHNRNCQILFLLSILKKSSSVLQNLQIN